MPSTSQNASLWMSSHQELDQYYCLCFFKDTATTEIYTLSLHDALPICLGTRGSESRAHGGRSLPGRGTRGSESRAQDRKSTRLNSSHVKISYAVFCLKKKKKKEPRLHSK